MATAGADQSIRASAGGHLAGVADAVGRLRHGRRRCRPQAVQGGQQQLRAAVREPVEQLTGGVGRAGSVSVITPYTGPVSMPGLQPEGGGAGDVVAGPDRRLHRAAPRQAGNREKCRLTQPCGGTSSTGCGSSAP